MLPPLSSIPHRKVVVAPSASPEPPAATARSAPRLAVVAVASVGLVGAALVVVGAIHLEALMMALVALGLAAAKRGRPAVALILLTAAASVKWPAALAAVTVIVWHAYADQVSDHEPQGVHLRVR